MTLAASRTKCEIRAILLLLPAVDTAKRLRDVLVCIDRSGGRRQAARYIEGDIMDDVFGHLDL